MLHRPRWPQRESTTSCPPTPRACLRVGRGCSLATRLGDLHCISTAKRDGGRTTASRTAGRGVELSRCSEDFTRLPMDSGQCGHDPTITKTACPSRRRSSLRWPIPALRSVRTPAAVLPADLCSRLGSTRSHTAQPRWRPERLPSNCHR